MFQRARSYSALFALVIVTGCAGNGEGLDQNGRPATPDTADNILTAEFNSIQDNVFTPVCSVCHSGAAAPRGLRLDAGNSYTLLVGVASSQAPQLQRVQPGNPDASYLLQKITGAAAVGQRMPLGGPYLPQATIDVIRQWIVNGAQRPVSAGKESLRVVTTAPLSGDVVATPPQIVIGFNRDIDTNLVNATTVVLEKLAANTAESVATTLSVPVANASTLLITPRSELAAGIYRLTMRGSGGGALAGTDARPLNSSDGTEGQDYTTTFTVEVQP